MSFLESLDKEIEEIETALKASPLYAKREQLLAVRALYEKENPRPHATVTPQALGTRRTGETKKRARRSSPERLQAMQATRSYLAIHKEPVKTAELFEHIKSMGIRLGGGDPQNNYSALLYHSGEFQSHGRAGWTLKNTEASNANPEQETLEASSSNPDAQGREAGPGGGIFN